MKILRALVSVFDKRDLDVLAQLLAKFNVQIVSTGNTAQTLAQLSGKPVMQVSEVTGFPEILGGRVKTLHPNIHGGILARRDVDSDMATLTTHNITPIDLVVCNLYPFQETVAKNTDFAGCIEQIDIGGPTMIRAAAKNHQSCVVISSPAQYAELAAEMEANNGGTTDLFRKRMAAAAFLHTAQYDAAVSKWFAEQVQSEPASAAAAGAGGGGAAAAAAPAGAVVVRAYEEKFALKYGCNPHQKPASILTLQGSQLPFRVLNGTPGYINLLDAINAWSLVRELHQATGQPAAASFKHVSPAGAAIANPSSSSWTSNNVSDSEIASFDLRQPATAAAAASASSSSSAEKSGGYSAACRAYIRARNADPLCSFGDFAALSVVVDDELAEYMKAEVSDGIIAAGFTPRALEILKAKKGGGFIVIEGDVSFVPPADEYREIGGVVFHQKRNDVIFNPSQHLATVVTSRTDISAGSLDLAVASITAKYTQSNSVVYSKDGAVVGVGAGQQSRVDCVKLAGRKVETWYLRQHPRVLALPFLAGVKRQARVNARVRFIDGEFVQENEDWKAIFSEFPQPLSAEERRDWLATLDNVALSSDAFFPFRDSIDEAKKRGVKFLVQPGGSVADQEVIAACNEFNMAMAFSSLRLFHH